MKEIDFDSAASSALSRHTRAMMLMAVDIVVVAAGIAFAFVVVPDKARELVALNALTPDIIACSHPIAAISCIPLVIAGVCAWRIFSAIGRDDVFTVANARRLNTVAALALAEGVLLAALAICLLVAFHVSAPALGLLFGICVVFAILANALSHLTLKAAAIKDENDLTV